MSGTDKKYEIVMATKADKNELLSLYDSLKGYEGCPWDEDYPSEETIDFDLKRDALFVLKEDGIIKATVSIDDDDQISALECWNSDLAPEAEIARIGVLPDSQKKGYGKIMIAFIMEEAGRRGYKGIRMLVNRYNQKAIRLYAGFDFNVVGECHMYDEDFLCYEKPLQARG